MKILLIALAAVFIPAALLGLWAWLATKIDH